MYFLKSISNNPYFNIATEEYLLRNFSDDFFFIYSDEPSIICGKHQNILAEIDYPFVRKNNISVVRRLSGGGTVYHDLGNVNFCFILNVAEGKQIDFKRHTAPLITALTKMGANPSLGVRNDILIDNFKVSGNAEHIWKNRVLHHGTLLFDSDLQQLGQSINSDSTRFTDKAIKSKRSKVANILPFLSSKITQQEFVQQIFEVVSETYSLDLFELTESDNLAIDQLVQTKYQTWDWDFGYSPKYQFSNEKGEFKLDITVEKGVITEAQFWKNNLLDEDISAKLIGTEHRLESIFDKNIIPTTIEKIEKLFF